MNLTRKPVSAKLADTVSLLQLLGMAMERPSRWLRRQMLQGQLRSLQGLSDYFEWQQANGRAGLADTHKRMAITKAELNDLR